MNAAPARTAPPATAARSAPVLRRCACGGRAPEGGECAECRARRMGLRRSATSAAAPGFAPPLVHDVLRSPGTPLDAGTREFMEPRFGHSFADVRIHADGRAAESAEAVSARAYAVGRDIVFGAGRYAPGSMEGRGLIAHELAHVVQQSASANAAAPLARLEIRSVDAPEEHQAEAAARRVMVGGAAVLGSGGGVRVARATGGGTEEMHHDLAEQWRRDHGLPPGGRDESGRQVGPDEGQIVHAPDSVDPRPVCPSPDDETALLCIGSSRPTQQVTCRLTGEHRVILAELRDQARVRVQRAAGRIRTGVEADRRVILHQAGRSFTGDPPDWARISEVILSMESILSGAALSFDGAACEDDTCYKAGRAGYVDDGKMPMYVCMRSFTPAVRPRLTETIVHEVAHLAGVETEWAYQEHYCPESACGSPCHGVKHADAWMHFINCIGGPAAAPPAGLQPRPDPRRGEPVRPG